MTHIEYFGQSCFRITFGNGFRYVFDPYEKGSIPGCELPDLEAEAVLCSHGHGDHNAAHRVRLSGRDIPSPVQVSYLTVPHDDRNGELRGMNRIYILEGSGLKIAHFGDTGRELTEEEAGRLADCDLIMIPCGGFYTIDSVQAAAITEKLAPKLTVLMHFRTDRTGYDVLEHIDTVLPHFHDAVFLAKAEADLEETTGVIALTPDNLL